MKVSFLEFNFLNPNPKVIKNFLNNNDKKEFNLLSHSHKKDWLAGRLSLKKAFLLQTSMSSWRDIVVKKNRIGMPFIRNKRNLHCSVAHSCGVGLGVVSESKTGCDVELIRPHSQSVVHYICSKDELKNLKLKGKPNNECITKLWTVKEAVLKAIGKGFKYNPQLAIIKGEHNDSYDISLGSREAYKKEWKVYTYRRGKFILAIAMPKNDSKKPKIHRYKFSELCPSKKANHPSPTGK